MASYQGYGHNPATCPEINRQHTAETRAAQVYRDAEDPATSLHGNPEYVNLGLDNLPKSADLMGPGVLDTSTSFNNELEAKKYRDCLLSRNPKADPTIPQSDNQRKAHVKVLVKAFKCVPPECECQEAIKRPFRGHVHNSQLVECLCWDILNAIVRRSQVVTNLVDSYEPNKYKLHRGAGLNFEARFNAIVKTMATSKSICKHLFDVPYYLKVVDDPYSNLQRVEANRKLNGLKARVMKRGKEAEAEDGREKKRVKTEDTEEDPMSPAIVSQSRRRVRATPAPSTVPRRLATPMLQSLPVPQNFSAPPQYGNYQMTPQSYPLSNTTSDASQYRTPQTPTPVYATELIYHGTQYDNQPSAYPSNYGRSMTIADEMHNVQAASLSRNYAPTSNVRFGLTHAGSASTSRAPSSASTRRQAPSMTSTPHHAPSTASTRRHAPSMASTPRNAPSMASTPRNAPSMASTPHHTHFTPNDHSSPEWHIGTAAENGIGHSYNSDLPALSRPYTTPYEPTFTNHNEYKDSGSSELSDVPSNAYDLTQDMDDGHQYAQNSFAELLDHAEDHFIERHDSTESDRYQDAPFESDN